MTDVPHTADSTTGTPSSFENANLLKAGNNHPVLLNDPAHIYIIEQGHVDIFAVKHQDTQITSPRTHLFRLSAGQAIFGIDMTDINSDIVLVAVGTATARLHQIKREQFESLIQHPDTMQQAVQLLDSWIEGLSSGVEDDVTLRQLVPLEANQTAELKAGEVARPRRGVMRVTVQTGMVQFVSREEMPLIIGGEYLPITSQTWLKAHRDSRLHIMDSLSYIQQQGFLWEDLARFHRIVMLAITWNLNVTHDVTLERLKRRHQQDHEKFDQALKDLSYILKPGDRDHFREIASDDTLLTACKMVGQALGVRVRARPDPIDGRQENQTLDTIVRNSGLRTREIMLRDKWWRDDNGPLLAFTEADNRPVALLPDSRSSYILHDPTTGERHRVNADIADTLAPVAYMLYRTLPAHPLTLMHLLRFGLQGAKRDVVMVLLMGTLAGLLGTAVPLITGRIFDFVIPAADRNQLLQLILLLLAAALAMALFQISRNIAILRTEIRSEASLQAAIWDRLLNLPAPFFRDYTAGDLSLRSLGAGSIRRRISGSVMLTLLAAVFSIFNFLLLFYFDIQLALVATGLVITAFLVSLVTGYRKMHYERDLVNVDGFLSGMVLQFITGISKFRVAGVEGRAFSEWAKHFTRQRRLAFRTGNIENVLEVFNETFLIIALMIIFWMTARSSTLSTGEFLAFNAAFTQFLLAGLSVSTALIHVLEIVPIYERMTPILQTRPESDETRSDPGELSGEIDINRISFRYRADTPLVLHDVTLRINPGEFVAIVGPSGSGKSTLLRLLLGFEHPESGTIFYDGQDLSKLDIHSVRQQLGVVLQNGQLMTGDIFTNIVGVAPLTLEDAWEAAAMAGLKDDIEQMPMGMHTVISEGGSTLSGGQRQRLLIARAIARKPKILFFDEATSALDNKTQAQVSQSLANLDATRIVIAHRLSTIINADHIVVMQRGEVVQQGTYAELIQHEGVFAELARRQLI